MGEGELAKVGDEQNIPDLGKLDKFRNREFFTSMDETTNSDLVWCGTRGSLKR